MSPAPLEMVWRHTTHPAPANSLSMALAPFLWLCTLDSDFRVSGVEDAEGGGGGNIRVLVEVSLSGVEIYGCHGV